MFLHLNTLLLKLSQSLTTYEESDANAVIIINPKLPYEWSQRGRCILLHRPYFSSVCVI